MVAEYYEDAIPALLAYINKPAYPHQLKARIYLGEAYYWLNRFDKAAEVLSDALAMNNNNPNAQYLLALSKFQQGKVDEAKLFYLMSRGLDLAEAQRLVVEASFQPVLARIPEEALRTEVETFIKGRIANGHCA